MLFVPSLSVCGVNQWDGMPHIFKVMLNDWTRYCEFQQASWWVTLPHEKTCHNNLRLVTSSSSVCGRYFLSVHICLAFLWLARKYETVPTVLYALIQQGSDYISFQRSRLSVFFTCRLACLWLGFWGCNCLVAKQLRDLKPSRVKSFNWICNSQKLVFPFH